MKINTHNTIKHERIIYILSTIILFIGMLENYQKLRYLIILPCLILIWIFIFIKEKFILNKKYIKKTTSILIILISLALPSYFNISPHTNNLGYSFSQYSLGFIFKVLSAITIIYACRNDTKALTLIIRYCLIINLSIFFIQFIVVYSTSYYIDPLAIITGEHQRYGSRFLIPLIGNIYRPTGFFEEPSTYAAFITCLLACNFLINERIDTVIVLSILSIILSLSVAALIYGTFLLLFILYKKNNNFLKIIISLIFPLFLMLITYFALLRLNSLNGIATEIRFNLMNLVFSQDSSSLIFGNGMLGMINDITFYLKNNMLWKIDIASLNDNGLWLFIIIKMGLIGLLLFITYVCKKLKTRTDILFFFILLTTKINLFSFMLIFYFLIIYFCNSDSPKKEHNYEKIQ
ncbi:hypothetical protein [Xenorhabdus anantnagensis]|uniref:O-antigen polymerase n=1 Tax=Xenorhabdus anantnagensis TaxID=3025875 RepID=A0ABT5LQV6_9GAMM|nr:hypothetical protein [Xenorhabdus anantnagensis]MDC9596812.1 hypothetical protein [Xenorhabdus anantnagensis]